DLTNQPVPRWVVMTYRALLDRGGLRRLPDPQIPGDTPEAIRRRFRWVRLAYFENNLAELARAMNVDRSYLSHFLRDPKRGLTDRLVDGIPSTMEEVRAMLRPCPSESGEC